VLIILFSVLISQLLSCSSQEDSLDQVKSFKPEDKYFKSSLVSLHFVMETSPIPEVDTFFNQLIQLHDLPISAEGAKDGTFIGESPYDAFDYKHVVKIKIKDHKITEVDYNEILKGGIGKQEDAEYCEEMRVTGTTPAIAYPILEQKLLSTQDILKVDAVSGASYSLYRFRYAVTIALMKAYL
jgi:major membrane immunogen (membrane-anchored lipoprotein)